MEEQLIYESARSKIFLAKDDEDRLSILKILNNDYPTPRDVAQFNNEFSITQQLNIPGIRRVLSAQKSDNKHTLCLEWFDGITMAEAFKNKQNDIEDFLTIAIEVTKVLVEIHEAGVIHKDISPFNILVNLQKRKVKIIDFGISSKSRTKEIDLSHPQNLQGTLSFSSPEQTGRMNKSVDYRTDLYSLGATFYAILAGKPPFVSADAMELVHAHIAKLPDPLSSINPNVPSTLSLIIAKLLEKNAENRYQSAFGLQFDLEKCLQEFQKNGAIKDFALADHDYSGIFNIPQKLYGREKEIDQILESFDRCADGDTKLLLVSGYSGTGKTALVHEVHRPITLRRGYYAEWKFDQFNKSTPYSAFLKVFMGLIDLFLLEKEETLNIISKEIQEAVGEEGKVLTDLLPNLELLIGKQPEIPKLGGEESQRRFNYLVQKFFRALCSKDHPIVFFIDDLQWADSSSLQLLNNLLTLPEGGYFLCIGAYRDNEVKEGHPLIASLANLENAGVSIETITISNLRKQDVQHLIGDALKLDPSSNEVNLLTDLVTSKTHGNAFFTTQFLLSIAESGLLHFDAKARKWTWDIDKIKAQNITDNVLELMADKVLKLPSDAQEVLKYAACLGNTVDLDMLTIVSKSSPSENEKKLELAIKEGLIFKINDKQLKFGHDRIQQAVYSLLDDQAKKNTHFKIGTLLHDISSQEQQELRLFDIVNHFNSALDLFKASSKNEILTLINLNVKAALKAKLNSAFNVALDYLHQALNLLPDNSWKTHYELTYNIYKELNEISYLCGEYDLTDKYFDEINTNATSSMDKVKAYGIKINSFKAKNNLPAAIDTGLEALELLGIKLPRRPNKFQVLSGLALTEFRLRNVDINTIVALPEMKDPQVIEAMRILTNISPSAYWAEPNLIPLIAYEMVAMSLQHGRNILSAYCFAGYGIIMCGILGAMRKGEKYGEIGLKILELEDTKEWRTQIEDPVYALILHWNKHVELSLEPLRDSFYAGLETGENEFACVNANIYCIHSFLCGKPLIGLEKEARAFSQTFNQLKQETQFNYNEVYRQAMLCFMEVSSDPTALVGSAYDSKKMLPQQIERKDKTGIFFINFNRMILSYHFGKYDAAYQFAKNTYELIDSVLSKFEIPNLFFYRSLAALSILQEGQSTSKEELIRAARQGYKRLKYFARFAPENFQHKCTLIESQFSILNNNFNKARLQFDQAIKEAGEQRFIHEEALAYELAGKAYHQNGFTDLARFYLSNSYNLYREWGAKSKMDFLVKVYPRYFTAVSTTSSLSQGNAPANSSTFAFENEALDMKSLLKASTSISGEVELSQLLTKLMQVLIENAGAQKGALIMLTNGNLFVEAIRDLSSDHIELLRHTPLADHSQVPTTIINYIHRTGKRLVNNSFDSFPEAEKDAYFQKFKPESSLGLPIINQGKFLGVIYLENRNTKNTFTPSRTDFLAMLSSQIAVSIDNALLYQNLEKKVEERTHELNLEKRKSDDLLFNILPKEVAEELKETGRTEPKHYESVTVLFTDFVGFTNIATTMSAAELVSTIDKYFKGFDQIVARHKLEKIKTIGDAYMCAGGLPVPNTTHALDAVKAALEMIKLTDEFRKELPNQGGLSIRVGIHTGPVVAGVVGTDKFAYDIWGNTVNLASRLESNSEAGRINISEETFSQIKEKYDCQYRGKLEAKNIGEVDMYYVQFQNLPML